MFFLVGRHCVTRHNHEQEQKIRNRVAEKVRGRPAADSVPRPDELQSAVSVGQGAEDRGHGRYSEEKSVYPKV